MQASVNITMCSLTSPRYMWLPSKNEALLSLAVLDNDCGVVLYSVTVKDEGGFESHKVASISGKVLSEMLKPPRSDSESIPLSLLPCVLISDIPSNVNLLEVHGSCYSQTVSQHHPW